jgi:Flp pilus assembly protein CpaB
MINSVTDRVSASRGWAIAIGVGAAVLAGILLLLYLNRYRESVAGETAPTSVLVAKNLITQGTSGTVIGTKELYQVASLPAKEVKVGALADPAYLNGRVAVADILPSQQLTTADFTTETTTAVNTKITGAQRGISIGIDNIHGSLPHVAVGDHVDIYIALGTRDNGQSIVKLFRSDVKVLAVPNGSEGTGTLVLQVTDKDAADFAYAADNVQFYFTIRPKSGARRTRPDTATINTVIASR